MPRSRTSAADLARLMDAVGQPLYVLDEEHTLVFCNRACLEWTAVEAADLLGRRCLYHSGEAAAEATAGLCPPPAAWSGHSGAGVVGCRRPDGQLSRRRARFFGLPGGQGAAAGLVVLVEVGDCSGPEALAAAAEQGESVVLHQRLREFRAQAAARVRLDRLVGDTPAIQRARARAELAAGSRASVLLVGPPGSGRQHLAAAIHYACPAESLGPLIPLACSVLGAELIQSTIAALAADVPSSAHSGCSTLLLNDADQLPLEVQAELRSVLGGRPFPLRLIATARQPLDALAGQGKFRSDLAALLSTISIELPALVARRPDLPVLAQCFLEQLNGKGGKQVGGFSPQALDVMDAYHWPGNLDELGAVVAEAHQRAEGPEIAVGDLPPRLHLAEEAAAYPRRAEPTIVLDEFLGRVERELIDRALARAKGNKSKAARLLGMTRPRLYRRMVQLGLLREGR
jgi:DNA-binding NtrC family response regulator